MGEELKFYDDDDREIPLDTLCRKEPEWAANRMREGIKRIHTLEAENERLKKFAGFVSRNKGSHTAMAKELLESLATPHPPAEPAGEEKG